MDKEVKKSLYRLPVATFILFAALTILVVASVASIQKIVENTCFDRVDEAAVSAAKSVDSVLDGNQAMLDGLGELLAKQDDLLSDSSVQLMTVYNSMLRASRLRLITPDNKLYSFDGTEIELSGSISFDQIAKKGENFSNRIKSLQYDDQDIIRQYSFIYKEGKIIGILYVTYVCDDIPAIVEVHEYNGQAGLYIIDRRNADYIADSYDDGHELGNMSEIEKEKTLDGRTFSDIEEEILKGNEGTTAFYNVPLDKNMYLAYAPTDNGYYEILVAVEEEVAMKTMRDYRSIVAVLSVIAIVFGLIYFIWEFSVFQKMKYLFSHDSLTGALNRYGLEETLNSLDSDCVGVMIMDIDYFKNINDSFGRENGDRILKEVVEVMQSVISEDAVIHRCNGEQFAIVYKRGEKAFDNANMIHSILRSHAFRVDGKDVFLTVSAGLVISEDKNEIKEFDRLILEADDRLYRAKNEGRDRIVFMPAEG